MEYQIGDIWRAWGKLGEADFLILSIHGDMLIGFWLQDDSHDPEVEYQMKSSDLKYVNVLQIFRIRARQLIDFIRAAKNDELDAVRGMASRLMGLQGPAPEVRQDPERQDPDKIKKLEDELIKVKAQRDVYRELYLREGGEG